MPLPETTSLDSAAALRVATQEFLDIADTTFGGADSFFLRFRGRLRFDSIEAYRLAAEKFRPLGFTPLFRKEGGDHVVLVMKGIIDPKPSNALINLVMFGMTILSAVFAGGLYEYAGLHPEVAARFTGDPLGDTLVFFQIGIPAMPLGWPFAVSLLAILLAHEFGHYFAARYHKIAVTLPYFIPMPLSLLGTMGAVIQLKEPPRNKRVLLDIGIAGPLAGFVVAVPIVIYGLITSGPLKPLEVDQVTGFEGNSILYVSLKYLIFGKLLPEPASFGNLPSLLYMLRFYLFGIFTPGGGQDVLLNQVAWAGWAGLLVTGLNLIPAGQLDGGHAIYVLIGKRAGRLIPIILVILIGMGFFWFGWFLWAGIIYFLGRTYAEPLDQITELDSKRKVLAVLALVLFVLVVMPIPNA